LRVLCCECCVASGVLRVLCCECFFASVLSSFSRCFLTHSR
jgi:hypothetical protein